jgi:hypothetical protein
VSFKTLRIAITFIFALNAKAQTFDIEQTSQLIRPRVKLDSKYTCDPTTKDTGGAYACFENSASFTFPIKRKFKTEINLDLKDFKLKDLFKKNIRIKASEVLGTFKVTQRNVNFGIEDTMVKRGLYYANAGIIGLHLTKKYRILFYSANMNLHEDGKTLNKFTPRFSAIAGQYHICGLRKGYYYGISLIYSDGLFIPSPFIGGIEPLGERWTFNYSLPVQLNIQYYHHATYVVFGVKTDGYRSGIKLGNGRGNMNYANGCTYLNVRRKLTRTVQVYGEFGYNFYQFMSFDDGIKNSKIWPERVKVPMNTSFYGHISIQIYFGKSLLEKVTDQLF